MNDFTRFWDLGYRTLLPVIPPDARVSLTQKGVPSGDAGKSPGEPNGDGSWHGYPNWQSYRAVESDLSKWAAFGAGVGLRCENGLLAIDCDTPDASIAEKVRALILATCGPLPERVGNAPKTLFLCRTDPTYFRSKITFDGGEIDPRTTGQFVAAGIHKTTRQPYVWVSSPVEIGALPFISPRDLEKLWDAIVAAIPGARHTSDSAPTTTPRREDLLGDPVLIRRAMRAIPNDYKDRDTYIRMGAALKAAHPDEDEAKELFDQWCRDWTWGTNDQDVIDKDWASLKGRFLIGAQWLYNTATLRNPVICPHMWQWHEKIVEPGLAIVNAVDLAGLPIPEQKWLVRDMIPAGNVTLLGGDGGTGKSLLALQLSIAKASGGEWLGYPLEAGGVLYLSAEDEIEEQHRRTKKIYPDMWSLTNLNFAPLAGEDAVLAAPEGKEGLLKETKIFHAMETSIKRLRPTLTVLDTQADLFGGDEIKKIHARSFISMLRGLALRYDTTILLLYHPSLSGMASGSGTSGNVAWGNSVRSRLYLEFIKDAQGNEIDSDKRKLEVKKSNRAAKGSVIPLRWTGGKFAREGSMTAPSETGAEAERLFLDLLDQLEREDRYVSHKQSSKTFAPKVFAAHHRAEGIGERHFINAMNRLLEQTVIRITTYRRDSKTFDRIARATPTINGLFE